MSIETQAILLGHVTVEQITNLLSAGSRNKVTVRNMQRAQYKILDLQDSEGNSTAIHVFLESWAADDYADAFQGPSTFMTAEYNPRNVEVFRALISSMGGLTRRTTDDPWIALEPST